METPLSFDQLMLFDVNGTKMKSDSNFEGTASINLIGLSLGIYSLEGIKDLKPASAKIIKKIYSFI